MNGALEGLDVAPSVLDLIGRTPLVRLGRLEQQAGLTCPLVAKLETTNPGGSVKDRPALTMIEAAEQAGLLKPGGTIIEPTSGNTGVGLAVVAAQRGYRCIFVMTDKVAPEKVALLRAYGAEVVVCPVAVAPDDPASYYSTAARLLEENPEAFGPSQYHNLDNPRSHYETTGPEIWTQTQGRVTHLVVGAGTGGTVSGAGRYLKEQQPTVQIVVADPDASVYAGGDGRPYLVEGIGEDFWPTTYDPSVVDQVVPVTDAESFAMARNVTRTEGLLIGGSGGTAVHGAIEVAKQLGSDDLVVVVIPDSGRGYLTRVFDDGWMAQMGFAVGPAGGGAINGAINGESATVGDVLPADHRFVYVKPDDTCADAATLMDELGLDDLPVAKGTMPVAAAELVGTISRSAATQNRADQVAEHAGSGPPRVGVGEELSNLAAYVQPASPEGSDAAAGSVGREFSRANLDGRPSQQSSCVVVMRDGRPAATVSAEWLTTEIDRR